MSGLLPATLLEDLRTQKLRLTLTLFGIFWGTFAVVVLLAFGAGLERKADEELGGGAILVWKDVGKAWDDARESAKSP